MTSLALVLSGLLACACSSAGTAGAGDAGAGGSGGAAAGTKFGAVIVEAPGLDTGTPAFFASAAFSDLPRLVPAGELTSLDFGIGEPGGCTKKTVDGCQVFRCPKVLEATRGQSTDANVGPITIAWSPASGGDGGVGRPPITVRPDSYDLFFWQTESPVTRFEFSAAGGTIPAFPATGVDVPQIFEISELAGAPALGPHPPPSVPRAAGLRVTWTGGTAEVVFGLHQVELGSDDTVRTALRAVCRVAASAGSFSFSSRVLGEFQPGEASLAASVVSSKMTAAGDHATTLAIAAPYPWHFPLAIE